MRGDQLVVGTSQDETNIEKQALPLKILMHPPPSSLNATHGFLLPPFHVSNKRSDYAACGMQSVHMVHASAMDTRFQVLEEVVELNQDCLGSASHKNGSGQCGTKAVSIVTSTRCGMRIMTSQ